MLKKYTVLVLIALMINLTFGSFVFAQETETRAAEKIKVKVAKLGVGGKLIEVKLADKTKVKGYITEIKDSSFVLVSKKNAASTNISYDKVKSVQRTFSTAVYVFAGVVGVLSVVALVACGAGYCEN